MTQAELFTVRRGELRLTSSESGTLQAERMERTRSRVEGRTTIISIVPEGTYISEEDVRNGKVLVELDSANLQNQVTNQEIQVENADTNLTTAREGYDIQVKQNQSNIRKAELNVKFARMELEHYLGKEVAARLDEKTDFSRLRDEEGLGGAALQRKIQLDNDMKLAEQEIQLATDRVDWTNRLYEKQYVTRNELQADELALKRQQAVLVQNKGALDLFFTYELPRDAESRCADWREYVLELDRVRARADSDAAQALARLKSTEATFNIQKQQLDKVKQQIGFCTIRATKPGLVVYASSSDFRQRMTSPIQEGVSVYERQEIIRLPDLSSMIAELKVHESSVKQIQPGQRAMITVDAIPDLRLEGEVKSVGGLPDPQNFMQDTNVFTTNVTIRGKYEGLKPGMSCKAEITIAIVPDAVHVPVQCVTPRGNQKVCFVETDHGQEIRPVKTGVFDDRFVEITSGLSKGERVMLSPPLVAPGELSQAAEEAATPAAPQEQGAPKPPAVAAAPAEAKQPQATPDAPAEAQQAQTPPAGSDDARAQFRKKMQDAGVTMEDMQRWRSQGMTDEDVQKLKKAGLSADEIEKVRTFMKGGGGPRRRQGGTGEAPAGGGSPPAAENAAGEGRARGGEAP